MAEDLDSSRPTGLRETLARSPFRLAALFLLLLLGLWLGVRVTLLALHGAWPGALRLTRVLAVGEVLDLLAGLWLALPLFVALALLPSRWRAKRWARATGWAAFAAAVYGILFSLAAEIVFFTEFDGRFNFVAVNYLIYPTEVVTNIWESYPTGWILAALGVATAAVVWAARRVLGAAPRRPVRLRWRLATLAAYGLTLAAITAAVPSELAHGTGDRTLDEISENGPHAFWLALLGHDAPYQGLYACRPEPTVRRRLAGLLADARRRGGTTPAAAPAAVARARNVVVVLEESLGAEFVGALRGDGVTYTPSLDALAAEGQLWTQAYSTGNRTIRAIEATTLSIPPLPGISLVQRTQSRDLVTLPQVLRERGYRTLFVYGGRALFDGMGGYLRDNGVERVVEQADYPSDAFRTAWGVADEEIFTRTIAELDAIHASGDPFYALVLTVSNHRPYHFPEDHVQWDSTMDRRHNAVRYADWALGDFIRRAREHPFFADTLFVLMGDHGARAYGAAEVPLASYHVPILFLAPGALEPGRIGTLASSLDVPATILARLGYPEPPTFFGRPLLAEGAGGRALMTHNNEVALLAGDRMAVLGLHGSSQVFGCDEALVSCDRELPADAPSKELVEDAIAYYEGADLLYRSGALTTSPPPATVVESSPARLAPSPRDTGAPAPRSGA